MTNYYNINYQRLGIMLLPELLRGELIIALVSAIMQPFMFLQRQFTDYRNSIDTSVSSQTCRMQGLINDLYDYHDRRIVIRTIEVNLDTLLICREETETTVMLGAEATGETEILVREGFIGTSLIDFEVVFPAGFVLSQDEERHIRRVINMNKLASKRFRITYE